MKEFLCWNTISRRTVLTACCTDTTITLSWEKPAAAKAVETYTVLRNDAAVGTTAKTHFTLEYLHPETEYTLFVQWRGGGIGELTVRTTSIKHRLDVTAAPYFAVGDGKTMNTAALQKAIDDCTENECVYFPAGVCLTGALRLHSNMELYLDEGLFCRVQRTRKIICPASPAALRVRRWSVTAAC